LMFVLIGLGALIPCAGVIYAKTKFRKAPISSDASAKDVSKYVPENDELTNDMWTSAADNPLRVDSNVSHSFSARFLSLLLPTWADRLSSESEKIQRKKTKKENREKHKHDRTHRRKKRKHKQKKLAVEDSDLESQQDEAIEEGLAVVVESEATQNEYTQDIIPVFGWRADPPLLPMRVTNSGPGTKKKKKKTMPNKVSTKQSSKLSRSASAASSPWEL
jgi:hypothetical protein